MRASVKNRVSGACRNSDKTLKVTEADSQPLKQMSAHAAVSRSAGRLGPIAFGLRTYAQKTSTRTRTPGANSTAVAGSCCHASSITTGTPPRPPSRLLPPSAPPSRCPRTRPLLCAGGGSGGGSHVAGAQCEARRRDNGEGGGGEEEAEAELVVEMDWLSRPRIAAHFRSVVPAP